MTDALTMSMLNSTPHMRMNASAIFDSGLARTKAVRRRMGTSRSTCTGAAERGRITARGAAGLPAAPSPGAGVGWAVVFGVLSGEFTAHRPQGVDEGFVVADGHDRLAGAQFVDDEFGERSPRAGVLAEGGFVDDEDARPGGEHCGH